MEINALNDIKSDKIKTSRNKDVKRDEIAELKEELNKLMKIVIEKKKEEVIAIQEPAKPQEIKKVKKKSRIWSILKLMIYPTAFIFYFGLTFIILSTLFNADITTKAIASLISAVITTSMIILFVKLGSKGNSSAVMKESEVITQLEEIKLCKLCDSRLLKSQVINSNDNIKQYFKCSNPICDFKKEVVFSLS